MSLCNIPVTIEAKRHKDRGRRPNKGMHPTPLRGPKIGAILEARVSSTVVPISTAARVMPKPFGGV